MAHKNEILPDNVVPIHYDITIETLFDTLTFKGTEDVTLEVKEKSNVIVLNALCMKIESAKIGDMESSGITLDEEKETATITFPQEVGAVGSKIKLSLVFSADLDANMRGYYKSKHESGGKTNWIATTQFEPVDARRAFPCWDEPALKSTFKITLVAPKDMITLSNMPAKSETVLGNGSKSVEFEVTPIMSTYLVAYVVGHFECVEGALKSGSKVRIWAVPGKLNQCHFALENAIKILEYYEDYFDIPYPLPKTDMIALPDFQMGAMENWGLITYRETALLCTESASVTAKSRVVYVIAHELAHQWFGNLVSPAWWKQLWLNEGFASFIGAQATAHFYPEWRYWDQFVVSYINSGLKVDSSRTSHPIEVEISVARSVQEIFDVISYQKGASVINMISKYLGEDAFQKGLQTYLKKFSYSNAVTSDLWDHLSLASGKDVSNAMDNWIKEMGYPVITIEETSELGKYRISQRRFLGSGLPTAEEDKVIWNVNIGVITESQTTLQYVTLSEKEQIISLPVKNSNEWVKLNAGQSGFYRVQYSSQLSERLTAALKNPAITSVDRLGLLNDVFSLASAGTLPLSQALALASQYTDETDAGVWGCLIDNLALVGRLFSDTEAKDYFKNYMLKLFNKIGTSIGWEPTEGQFGDDLWKQTRTRVLDVLGEYGDATIIAEANKRMEGFEKDNSSLSTDLVGLVFKYWLRNSENQEKDSEKMIQIYQNISTNVTSSPEMVIKSLSCIGYSKQLEKTLNFIFDSDTVRPQDLMYPFQAICSSSEGREAGWKFIQSEWEKVSKRVAGSLLGHVITIATNFHTEQKLNEVESFFSTISTKELVRTIKNRIEAIKTNIKTLEIQKESTIEYLKNNYSS